MTNGKRQRLKDYFKGLKDHRTRSDKSDSLPADDNVPSNPSTADAQQAVAPVIQQGNKTEITTSQPSDTPDESINTSLEVQTVDISGWDGVWREAYKKVNEDPKQSKVIARLELFLEKGDENTGDGENNDLMKELAPSSDDGTRLKTIQRIAQEKLKAFEEGKLSFRIGDKSIVVRDSVIKTVNVINTFKPIVSGAVAAEPAAALAWAGITTALPILENIFQQDENAATGLTEITFLMARYQRFHEPEFTSELLSKSNSMSSRKRLEGVRNELISIYADFYIYEARFILEYAMRTKMHRVFRNAVDADQWKTLLSEIQTKSRRIDDGIRDHIGDKTIEMWTMIKEIEMNAGRIESLQRDTLEAVQEVDRRQLIQSLKVTGNATFDSRQTSSMEVPCLPGTQVQMLETIHTWAKDPAGQMIFWLEGMAGTGKTSISMTVATALKEGKPFADRVHPLHSAFLGASFFFNHSDATRNSTLEFFTTLASSLSGISSDNGSPIIQAIRENPGIETKSPQEQFRKLIADPLAFLDKNTFMPFQLFIVIDALDECDDKDAEELLSMLENLVYLNQVRLRFFITSRREEHISSSFTSLPYHLYQTARLHKVEMSPGDDDDITLYLSNALNKITKRRRPKDGGISNADIKKLAERADGLFIYAVTACRFLDGPDYRSRNYRDKRLALIFEGKDGPQQAVDDIYLKVLTFPDREKESNATKEIFYHEISGLIGFIVVLLRPVSVETLCHLLRKDDADLAVLLGYLHPLLNVPDDSNMPVSLIHLSFRDFILDEKRAEILPFSVKELDMHRDIFGRCLDLMSSGLLHNICCLELPGTLVSEVERSQVDAHIPQYLRYACVYWVSHLARIERESLAQVGVEDGGAVQVFLQEKLLFWLEVMALIGEAPAVIPAISQLEGLIEPSKCPDLLSLVHDAKRFIHRNRWLIEHAPLQLYCSALLFCTRESKIRFHYQHLIPEWITTQPDIEELDSGELLRLEGHSDRINDSSFSTTEALLASVSNDNTTRVWDYITGSEKYRFHDPGTPKSVSFSVDGKRLASGCSDGTICLRDLTKATDFTLSCPSGVMQISFSPTTSNILASLGDDGTLLVWNIDDKQQAPAENKGEPSSWQQFVFSPDGQFIAVCRMSYVTVFNVTMAEAVTQFKLNGRWTIDAMTISVDSKILAVNEGWNFDFWDVTLSSPKLIKSCDAKPRPYAFLRLPASMILRRESSGRMELCDNSTSVPIGTFQQELGRMFSYDGAWLADQSGDHPVIRILSDPYVPPLRKNMSLFGSDHISFLRHDNIVLSWDDYFPAGKWNVANGHTQISGSICVNAITFSPCENFILLSLGKPGSFQVWNQSLTKRQANFNKMASVAFLPSKDDLATLSQYGELQILRWDAETSEFKPIRDIRLQGVVFKEPPSKGFQHESILHFSPGGEEAIVFFHSQSHVYIDMWSCQLWNLKNIEKNTRFNHSVSDGIPKVIFSPRNDFFIIDSRDSVRLYYLPSGELVDGCDLDGYRFFICHPVDRIFAAASDSLSSIAIWEGLPWTKKFTFTGHEHLNVTNLAFSATNKIAAFFSSHEVSGNIINVWDHTTGQRICSHAIESSGSIASFNLSPDGDFLETNRGRIPIPYDHTTEEDLDRQRKLMGNCLYVMDQWIFHGYKRLLWLPSAHRPRTGLPMRDIDVRKGMIAIAQANKSVMFIGVSLEETPIAMRNMRLNH